MGSLRRLSALTAILVAVWVLLPPVTGMAQIPLPLPTQQPTPDPDPSPDPTPTREPSPEPEPTRSPKPDAGGSRRGSGGGRTRRPPAYTPTPEERAGIEIWLTRQRTPARTTTRLLELLARATPGAVAPTAGDLRRGFGRFPVVGYTWYQDDYGAPRYRGTYVFHAGTDLFAVTGTPVISVVDGTIWRLGSFSRGGNAIWLQGDDGVRYYYGHLHSYRSDLRVGTRVSLGEQLGTVGASGQANGYPHVHFEVNPGGLGTVNPKPVLDAWLRDAEAAALQQIAVVKEQDKLLPLGAARWDDLFGIMGEPPAPAPALWTAAWDGSTTLASLDLILTELAASRDYYAGSDVGARRSWDHVLAPIDLDHAD